MTIARTTTVRTALAAALLAPALALLSAPAQANTGSLPAWLKCRTTDLTEFNGTIVDAAIATPDLSTLVSLVKAADLVVGPLSGKGPLTVFAPTNGTVWIIDSVLLPQFQ